MMSRVPRHLLSMYKTEGATRDWRMWQKQRVVASLLVFHESERLVARRSALFEKRKGTTTRSSEQQPSGRFRGRKRYFRERQLGLAWLLFSLALFPFPPRKRSDRHHHIHHIRRRRFFISARSFSSCLTNL